MNLDLIYGLPGQSESSIMRNLDQVAELGPECITIYPLAVRELTGIGRLPQSSLMSTRDKYALYASACVWKKPDTRVRPSCGT